MVLLIGTFLCGCSDDLPKGKMPPVLKLGQMAPNFSFEALKKNNLLLVNETQQLSQYKGKVIYLDFWASWCKPCLKSMPFFDQLREELKASGFEVLAVNLDNNPLKGESFIDKYPVTYPVIRAIKDNINNIYQINGLPTSYIIDKQGVLRYAHQGFKTQDMIIIRQQILELLNAESSN